MFPPTPATVANPDLDRPSARRTPTHSSQPLSSVFPGTIDPTSRTGSFGTTRTSHAIATTPRAVASICGFQGPRPLAGFDLRIPGLGPADLASFRVAIGGRAAEATAKSAAVASFRPSRATRPPAIPADGFVSSRSPRRFHSLPSDRAGTARATIRGGLMVGRDPGAVNPTGW